MHVITKTFTNTSEIILLSPYKFVIDCLYVIIVKYMNGLWFYIEIYTLIYIFYIYVSRFLQNFIWMEDVFYIPAAGLCWDPMWFKHPFCNPHPGNKNLIKKPTHQLGFKKKLCIHLLLQEGRSFSATVSLKLVNILSQFIKISLSWFIRGLK